MNVAKNALRAASTSRLAMKLAARPRPSTAVPRRYATGSSSRSANSLTAKADEDDAIYIPDRIHPDAPDLMNPDVLMDLAESKTFEPSRRTKFQNTITLRNDQNMFEVLREQLGDDGTGADKIGDNPYFDVPMASHLSSLYIHNILSRSVKQQTGKGKIGRQQVITVVGNQNGLVGLGIGKSDGFPEAYAAAIRSALRNMDYVERFEDRTIWTEMELKFGATRVIMRPRPVGFGLRCNPNVYHILKAAGIKDVSAKVWGSRNPMQVAHTVMQMLLPGCEPLGMGNGIGGPGKRLAKRVGMRTKDEIERERGRKLVPLRYP